jgi:hypothetical protein
LISSRNIADKGSDGDWLSVALLVLVERLSDFARETFPGFAWTIGFSQVGAMGKHNGLTLQLMNR